MSWRATICPFLTAGFSAILCTPMIAASGKLMIGVARTPPSWPSDEMVKVEPVSSSRAARPLRMASATRSISLDSSKIDRIAEAIRIGKATRDEVTGSTFTISSLGQLGGVLATPIVNFPEAAIMGVHKIAEKPAVRDGQIVIRQLMNLSISVDHRIADGYDGAMLLQEIKTLLEDPTLLFLEMV